MIKVAVYRMGTTVVDRALHVHGGGGVSGDFGLARMYANLRALRFAEVRSLHANGPLPSHSRQVRQVWRATYRKLLRAARPAASRSNRTQQHSERGHERLDGGLHAHDAPAQRDLVRPRAISDARDTIRDARDTIPDEPAQRDLLRLVVPSWTEHRHAECARRPQEASGCTRMSPASPTNEQVRRPRVA